MSDTETEPDKVPTEDTPPVEDDQGAQPTEVDQKLAAAETRITELTDAADKYARALFETRVAATGRLADPTDLAYSADLLDSSEALTAAIDELLARKPHLASRKPAWGDVGAGQAKPGKADGPTWADLY